MMWMEERVLQLFRRSLQHTLTYWSVVFSFGLSLAFLGPTVLDLARQTSSSLQDITWLFFSQQICLLIGSSAAGVFQKTLLRALAALFLSSLAISLVFAVIPLCRDVAWLAVAVAASGLAMGVIDTTANTQLVSVYQKDSPLFLQALHFFIGLGALLSPLIADPFLSQHVPGSNATENATGDHALSARVPYAFWTMALVNVPVPIAVAALMYREKLLVCCRAGAPGLLEKDELAMETQPDLHTEELGPAQGGSSIFSCCLNDNNNSCEFPVTFFAVHILGGMLLFMTEGIMGIYAGFVYTYAVSAPMWLHAKLAGYLTCLFWAAITAGRLVSIPLSYRFRPVHLLTLNLAGVVVTSLLLLVLHTDRVFLFVGSALLGLFLSSVFPCTLAYTEDVLQYRGCATTVLVSTSGVGEMSMQVLVGSMIQSRGSYSFPVLGVVLSVLAVLFLLALVLCSHVHRRLTGAGDKSSTAEEPAGTTST